MKKILILAATSAIAQAITREWLSEAEQVFLVGRHSEKLDAVVNDLKARAPKVIIHTEICDLSDETKQQQLMETAIQAMGGIDRVLIAQGVLPDQQACQKNMEAFLQAFHLNATSVMTFLTILANYFESQKTGEIVALSSVAGDRGRYSSYVYCSAKAALNAFLEGLTGRLFKVGVHVLTVKPGYVFSPMTAHLTPKPAFLWSKPEVVAKDVQKALRSKKTVLYTPWFWGWLFVVIRHVPHAIAKRLSW